MKAIEFGMQKVVQLESVKDSGEEISFKKWAPLRRHTHKLVAKRHRHALPKDFVADDEANN